MNVWLIAAAIAALVLTTRKPLAASTAAAVASSSGSYTTAAHEDLLIDLEPELGGIHASVMLAIEVHETGAFTSKLWREANNPGGIRFNAKMHQAKYVQNDGSEKNVAFARFATWQDGIRGHARVLEASRYDAARAAEDPYVQVDRIKAAGYATDPNWPRLVKAHLTKIMNRPGTRL